MHEKDRRPEHLGWIEAALRAGNPDLPDLRITAQSHYGVTDRIAFVDVFGVENQVTRRRQIRVEATNMLQSLGCSIQADHGCDVYEVTPIRPDSAHDILRMLRCLNAARGQE